LGSALISVLQGRRYDAEYLSDITLFSSEILARATGVNEYKFKPSIYGNKTSNKVKRRLKASVVIPTYYRSYDLSCLFESLLMQLVKPEEVLVIDDTPTTEIKNMCEKNVAEFCKVGVALIYVKNHRERSISIARNIGAKMAQGDIVLFIDSDIKLYPDYIKKVLNVFKKHPKALGVGSWRPFNRQLPKGIRYHSLQTLQKIFFLHHQSRNSCRASEYPIALSKTIYCEWLMGETMSYRRSVFNEFQFDENLKGYTLGEDFLFSNSIYQRYPRSLLLTPDAMATHSYSSEARIDETKFATIKRINSKYILTKLFGFKGFFMFGMQRLGILIFGIYDRVQKSTSKLAEK
jgi:cellulose synthase/poly-beta-1,6-N-acetylglucosamine synthase-like glycosyltransferase